MRLNKILLVTHDTSLSGAPKMLLLLWEMIKRNYPFLSIDVLSMSNDGVLTERFKAISEKFYNLNTYSETPNYSIKNRIKHKLKRETILSSRSQLITELKGNQYDVVFANTIVTLSLASQIATNNLIVNVHELDTVLEEYLPNIYDFQDLVRKFIVPSELNKNCLIRKNIDPSKIEIIRDSSKLEFKNRKFEFNDGAEFRVLGCGAAYWRKGDDLFIQIASVVSKVNPKIKFYWVGPQTSEKRRVNSFDVKKLNLEKNLFFIDEVEFNDLFSSVHLFALTSREDPFPLAAVEAGLYGLPIVCFDRATGISEVISESMVSSYMDVQHYANIILQILEDKERYLYESEKNKESFKSFLPENISEQIMALIIKTIDND